jgi:hypothetical protein
MLSTEPLGIVWEAHAERRIRAFTHAARGCLETVWNFR